MSEEDEWLRLGMHLGAVDDRARLCILGVADVGKIQTSRNLCDQYILNRQSINV